MKYVLAYGIMAGAIVIAVIGASLLFEMSNHATGSLLFGYLVMLVALSLIFVGVKRYRDVERGGVIRFLPAFGLGLGIAAVAGVTYALGWEIWLATSERDFMAEYSAAILGGMRADGAAPAAIAAKAAEMREMAIMYRNPLFRIPITFIEIFPVGLLVALVSAALLRNPGFLPPTRATH